MSHRVCPRIIICCHHYYFDGYGANCITLVMGLVVWRRCRETRESVVKINSIGEKALSPSWSYPHPQQINDGDIITIKLYHVEKTLSFLHRSTSSWRTSTTTTTFTMRESIYRELSRRVPISLKSASDRAWQLSWKALWIRFFFVFYA